MKKILIIIGHYVPGYNDGGPVRSIKNLTDYLGNEYDFRILTLDRDFGDTEAYSNIVINDWNRTGNAKVYYASSENFTRALIKKLASEVDLVYICGCFSDYAINTFVLKRFGKIKCPVVCASMGMFSPMAFKIKYRKKKIFITIFNYTGMFKNIFWSATSEMEVSEIKKQVNANDEQFFIAQDLPRKVPDAAFAKKKEVGELRVVWISRVAEKKNLLGAIRILKQVSAKIDFAIYGPIFEEEYWRICQEELEMLPDNISWNYRGTVDTEKVVETLKDYHVFLFPTFGENYGHVIQEALSAGCVCLLSNQTPWCDLEKYGIGINAALNDEEKFVDAIEYYSTFDENEMNNMSRNIHTYIINKCKSDVIGMGYRTIFSACNESNKNAQKPRGGVILCNNGYFDDALLPLDLEVAA